MKCSKCCVEKPLCDFYENRHTRSGYFARCKACIKARQNAWNRTEEGKTSLTKFKAQNKEKQRAYVAAYGRSEKGKLSRRKFRSSERGKEIRKQYLLRRYGGKSNFQKSFRAMMDASETPQKITAWSKANHAIKRGELVRQPCACGNTRSEAHHEDYSKPLEVIWLCASCHGKLHHQKRTLNLDSY